jgi:predicted transcriptional regulator
MQRQTASRKRSRRAEVTLKVRAAILHKIDNPGAGASECAVKGEIPRTTLRQNKEWQEWSPKIERAATLGSVRKLRAEWDRKTGQFLAVAAPSDVND